MGFQTLINTLWKEEVYNLVMSCPYTSREKVKGMTSSEAWPPHPLGSTGKKACTDQIIHREDRRDQNLLRAMETGQFSPGTRPEADGRGKKPSVLRNSFSAAAERTRASGLGMRRKRRKRRPPWTRSRGLGRSASVWMLRHHLCHS